MERPDLRKLKELVGSLSELEQHFLEIFRDGERRKGEIHALSVRIRKESAGASLKTVSVEELKNAGAGIPVDALLAAGYTNLEELAQAENWELTAIDGIGEKKAAAIRQITEEFLTRFAEHETIRLSVEDDGSQSSAEARDLIHQIAIFRGGEAVRRDAAGLQPELHGFTEEIRSRDLIENRVQWFFSNRAKKEQTVQTVYEIMDFLKSPLFERVTHFIELFHQTQQITKDEAVADFTRNAAAYYVLLEQLGGSHIPQTLVYDSVPEQLAHEIDAFPLDLTAFQGDLRTYQTFGTKYILHQGRVLLGDEMGLGKTIQAIAAMAHLYAGDPTAHFLIVSPLSVLVNWHREIRRFSTIRPYILHGEDLDTQFGKWRDGGGAAVTNYESMGRIIDAIDNRMKLKLLVIDEAHYIKNPQAQRTKHIHRLDDESERILMMTGTPLENHVEEMCALIDFIRPDMSGELRDMAKMSRFPQFREKLAPAYLRRTREQVLKELPPIEEEREWCRMTEADSRAYVEAIRERSFPAMRRVSFLQEDLKTSSKAGRLQELCGQAQSEGRKVVVYSFFRETIDKVVGLLGDSCAGVITGETDAVKRQTLIDGFADAPDGSILVCQIQAGGTGLNIQSASIVIFCEPQIKPSLENQAISRVYRMGQVRNVLVYRLLCEGSVDEAMVLRLEEKQAEFDAYADRSAMAEATENLVDQGWIKSFMEQESRKYLPMVV